MPEPVITLEFLSRQQSRILDEIASFRDDSTVLTAITLRLEASLTALITETRAMHSRHARLERRVRTLEGAPE
jgi:hypothetical protein